MRRLVFGVVIGMALLLPVTPAAASLEDNPTAFPAENLSCANGTEVESFLVVGHTGHRPSGFSLGVATRVVVHTPGGNFTVFEVPGRGLDDLVTACTWFGADGTSFSGDILLPGDLR